MRKLIWLAVIAAMGGSGYATYRYFYWNDPMFRWKARKFFRDIQTQVDDAFKPVKPKFTAMDRRHEEILNIAGGAMNRSIQAQKAMQERVQEREAEGREEREPGWGEP